MNPIVGLPLAALGFGILLQILLNRAASPKLKGWLAFLCGAIALAGTLAMLPSVMQGTAIDQTLVLWDQNIPLQYHVDGLSLIFALMATGIGSAILLYCIHYMAHETEGTTRFYVLMLTFIAGLVNLVFSANLLLVYFSWEVIGLCSYFLVGFWYKESAAANGARKVLVMTHIPGYGLLAGILLLYQRSGTFVWTDPSVTAAFTTGIFILMLVAAMAKSVMFPLHTWIPEAMNAPTPVSALLHSACYVKAGVYLIARMYSIAPWPHAWNIIVMTLGCITILIGAIFALAQTDMKRLLAYSTISQLGYIITALGLGTNLGVAAGLFYCLSHGLFKGTLFLCAGAVQHATGTRDMRRLGGLATRMPWTARIWLIAAAAIIGVPLTNGFVAKWLLLDAALNANQIVVVIVAWVVSVITAVYMLKATVSVFYGDMPAWLKVAEVHDAEPSMLAGMGILGGLCLLFGLAPQILFKSLVAPAIHALGFNWEVSLTYLGLQTTSAGVQVTLGAGIAVIAILASLLAYSLTRPGKTQRASVGVFTGGDPLPETAGMTAVDFTELAEANFGPVYKFTDPDRVYLPIWNGIRTLAEGFEKLLHPISENYPLLATLVLAVLVFITVWLS
ncbi:NADH:ubiquinone oxidoreductase subunit 5 [Longilinea arvoryzae]|uniref:NADH:ubiquinone oxidoreductase subunit 5 n=1 Tax=Longilinea arvoryzae TaxID=360412 RepID=A0A0S7B849_9CHLR|nr:NADH-quinone oxidoreductase subunit L [Longilinea arvoryzae]GAP13647.1 NADH:ubiquinone oxidoreductase subunit 5 [Longilinea arvoryzae]